MNIGVHWQGCRSHSRSGRSPGLEELAESQSVSVMEDVEALYRTWPGDDDDGFEQSVDELRRVEAGAAGDP